MGIEHDRMGQGLTLDAARIVAAAIFADNLSRAVFNHEFGLLVTREFATSSDRIRLTVMRQLG